MHGPGGDSHFDSLVHPPRVATVEWDPPPLSTMGVASQTLTVSGVRAAKKIRGVVQEEGAQGGTGKVTRAQAERRGRLDAQDSRARAGKRACRRERCMLNTSMQEPD